MRKRALRRNGRPLHSSNLLWQSSIPISLWYQLWLCYLSVVGMSAASEMQNIRALPLHFSTWIWWICILTRCPGDYCSFQKTRTFRTSRQKLCVFQTRVRGCENEGEVWDRKSIAGVLIWLRSPLCSPNPNCLWVIWLVPGMNNVISDFLQLPISLCFNSISYTDSLFWDLDLDLILSSSVQQETCDISLLNCRSVGYFCNKPLSLLCLQR